MLSIKRVKRVVKRAVPVGILSGIPWKGVSFLQARHRSEVITGKSRFAFLLRGAVSGVGLQIF